MSPDPIPDAIPSSIRVGVIANPRSHAYRSQTASRLARSHPGLILTEPDSQQALLETLRDFHARGVSLVVVNAGDGTLRHVLSALPLAYPGTPPRIALMPAGNTNLAAWSLGGIGTGGAALLRLLDAAAAGRLRSTRCPVLEVAWTGCPERPALRGLFFGAAGFTQGKRLADAEIHRRGVHLRHAVGLAVALTFVRSLSGEGALRQGAPAAVGFDGEPPREGRRFLLLATTLGRLTLGLWPFWGEGGGDIRWLDIDAPPPRLARAALATLLRRPAPWMQAQGYRSGRAARITLAMDEDFVLDGELFDPGPAGITLSCADPVTFVRP